MACLPWLAAVILLSGQGGPAAADRLGSKATSWGAHGLKDHDVSHEATNGCDLDRTKNETLQRIISTKAVALFGWSGCPCTKTAYDRLVSKSVCFTRTVWSEQDDPTFKYLQCVYGQEHHSFLFFKGKFMGNGFILGKGTLDSTLAGWLTEADAVMDCIVEGQKSLSGGPLQPCSNPEDRVQTGYTRRGTCEWQRDDAGFHQVCVTMSQQFLSNSAEKDGNDLSSVVHAGGHWCICAWAFASAVHRDNKTLEGLELDCDKTNIKLVNIYEEFETLTGPTSRSYQLGPALQKVFELCPHAKETAIQLRGHAS